MNRACGGECQKSGLRVEESTLRVGESGRLGLQNAHYVTAFGQTFACAVQPLQHYHANMTTRRIVGEDKPSLEYEVKPVSGPSDTSPAVPT